LPTSIISACTYVQPYLHISAGGRIYDIGSIKMPLVTFWPSLYTPQPEQQSHSTSGDGMHWMAKQSLSMTFRKVPA